MPLLFQLALHDAVSGQAPGSGLLRRALGWTLALTLGLLSGCGPAATAPVRFRPPPEVDAIDQLRASIAHASYARVAMRANEPREAYAAMRAALRLQPDAERYADAARIAEAGGLMGEATDCWQAAARYSLDRAARDRHLQEADRTTALIRPGTVRVGLVVQPAGSRVELRQEGAADSRPVLGDEVVWLEPGAWQIEDPESSSPAPLRRFVAGAAGPQIVAVLVERRGEDPEAAEIERRRRLAGDPGAIARQGASGDGKTADGKTGTGKTGDGKTGTGKTGDGKTGTGKTGDPRGVAKGDDEPPPEKPLPRPAGPSSVHRWAPYVVAGLGAAAAGAGGYFGWLAWQNVQIANDLNPADAKYDKNLATYGAAARDNAKLANIAFAAGGALVAGGATWLLLRPAPRSSVMLDAAAGPEAVNAPKWQLLWSGRQVGLAWVF